jgi:hypothetical protein
MLLLDCCPPFAAAEGAEGKADRLASLVTAANSRELDSLLEEKPGALD